MDIYSLNIISFNFSRFVISKFIGSVDLTQRDFQLDVMILTHLE